MGHSCTSWPPGCVVQAWVKWRIQMADKSPKKPTNKKVGKSLKEKRADKNAKKADKKYG